jgi:hypothetical protein
MRSRVVLELLRGLGHEPPPYRKPWWHLRAELRMWWLTISGSMDRELPGGARRDGSPDA